MSTSSVCRPPRPWPLGSLVVERDAGPEPSEHELRVVVGYKPDGRCMTVYASPAPWLTPAEQRKIHLIRPARLAPVRRQASAPTATATWRRTPRRAGRELPVWLAGVARAGQPV